MTKYEQIMNINIFQETYLSLPEMRELSSEYKSYVCQMFDLRAHLPTLSLRIMNDTGKQVKPKDLYNIIGRTKNPNRHNLDETCKYLKKKGNFTQPLHFGGHLCSDMSA